MHSAPLMRRRLCPSMVMGSRYLIERTLACRPSLGGTGRATGTARSLSPVGRGLGGGGERLSRSLFPLTRAFGAASPRWGEVEQEARPCLHYLIASGLTGEPTAPVIGIAGPTNMNS